MAEATDNLSSLVDTMFAENGDQSPDTAPAPTPTDAPADVPVQGDVPPADDAPAQPSVEDRLKEFGINDVSELEQWQQDRQAKAELERELEFMRMQAKVAQYQAAQSPAPTAEPQADPLAAFSPPEYDAAWDARYVEGRNEDGSIKWKADAPVEVRLKREQMEAFREQFANNFLSDPRKNFIEPLLEQAKAQARQEALEVFRQEQETMQARAVIDKALDDNASWIYAKDRNGNDIIGPDGQPSWSEAGKRWEAFYIDAKNSGVQSDAKALEYATRMYRAEYGEPKREAVKAAIQQNRVAAQMSPANHVAQRNGQQLPTAKAPSLRLPGEFDLGAAFCDAVGIT